MRPGWKPTRRNRNIGTNRSGCGQDNRFVIPDHRSETWRYRAFWEKLEDPIAVTRDVQGMKVRVFVEPTLDGFFHACTVDDVCEVLRHVPPADLQYISVFVLRQPKRKEQRLSSVWGRMAYATSLRKYSGPSVYVEAQAPQVPLKWPRSLTPAARDELDRLLADGHDIRPDRRHFVIRPTPDAIRMTQLFRTLPHEIGHFVDYVKNVEEPVDNGLGLSREERYDLFQQRPQMESERFADTYADRIRETLGIKGKLPFPRIADAGAMRAEGLDPRWFGLEGGYHASATQD